MVFETIQKSPQMFSYTHVQNQIHINQAKHLEGEQYLVFLKIGSIDFD